MKTLASPNSSMKLSLIICATILFSTFVSASTKSNVAKQLAISFFNQTDSRQKMPATAAGIATKYETDETSPSKVYIFEKLSGGFVVIAQNNEATKVLGYSPNGHFAKDSIPPALMALLKIYQDSRPENIPNLQTANNLTNVAEPLLDQAGIHLDQFHHEEVGGAWTGCVATAFAQIMAYHKYPQQGKGSHCYVEATYGQLCADFEHTNYNWLNPTYDDYKLLSYHIGIATNMIYGLSGSSPSSNTYHTVLKDYFRYSIQMGATQSDYIRSEIDNKRPVYAEIYGDPGHAVVLDGYNNDYYFHLNFGWGGQADGYYLMNTNSTFFVGYLFGTNIANAVYISPTAFVTNANDSLALVAFYNKMNGTTGWNLTAPVTEWNGVLVSNSRVVKLILNDGTNRMNGVIPEEIGQLTALRELNLGGKFDGSLPASLSKLVNLEWLSITNIGGSSTANLPADIGNLKKLGNLMLGGFTGGQIPASLWNLSNLTNLSLYNCNFTGQLTDSIGNMTGLTSLTLNNNKLSGNIPQNISKLSKLVNFDIAKNQLSGSLPQSIGELANLSYVDLSDNQFSGTIPDVLQSWSKLTTFKIANNQFTGNLPSSVGALQKITNLDISNNKITALPAEIGNLVNLELLTLNNNLLSTLPLAINNLKKLRELRAASNQLTYLDQDFGVLPQATIIDLSSNKLTKFPENFCYLTKLYSLSLNDNLIGNFPQNIELLSPKMDYLNLENNQLSGSIPVSLMENKMSMMNLANNKFIYEDIPVSTNIIHSLNGLGKCQKIVPLAKNSLGVMMGDTVHINITKYTGTHLPTSHYYWLPYPKYTGNMGEGYLTNETQDSVITVVINEKTIKNKYYCKIFNSGITWNYVSNNYTYVNPCLDYLETDTLSFKLINEDGKIAEQYPDNHFISSKNLIKKEVADQTVTLVPPIRKVRGTLKWQASADGKTWVDLTATMTQNDLKSNFTSISSEKLVLQPKTVAYYRTALVDNSCDPIYSDTIKVNPYGKVLADTTLNVKDKLVTIIVDSISVTIPQGIYDKDFRLSIVKLDKPPTAPAGVKMGSTYDVTVSFGSTFDLPLLVKFKNKKYNFDEKKIDNYKAVYYNEKNQQWEIYKKALLSLKDSMLVFETDHLTKLSWWYDEEAVWGYTDVFKRDNIAVFYKSADVHKMDSVYGAAQTDQLWHVNGYPKYIQDVAEYLIEVIQKLEAKGLAAPAGTFRVFIKKMDSSDGEVGLLAMLNGYLYIHCDIATPQKLQSLLAHEFMHYQQSGYFTPHAGNIFWAEAHAPLTDREIWNDSELSPCEMESYLTDGKSAANSIFKFLATSWDYWDSSIITQNGWGNLKFCYLAGTFLHYMRSYREGTEKLNPVTLLKETSNLGSWRSYLNSYITKNLKSDIGTEYEGFVKYILEGTNPKFSLLDNTGNPLGSIIGVSSKSKPEDFASKLVYRFSDSNTKTQKDSIKYAIPYLATKMLVLYNSTTDKAVVINYKRRHEIDKEQKVYIGMYDFAAKKMVYTDITDSTTYNFLMEPRPENAPQEYKNQCFLVFINKKNPGKLDFGSTFNASFVITATPVLNFTDLDYVAVGTDFIHTFSDGSILPFFIDGARRTSSLQGAIVSYFNVNNQSSYTTLTSDSSYRVNVTYSSEMHIDNGPALPKSIQLKNIEQVINYNYIDATFSIIQTEKVTNKFSAYHDNFSDKDVPESFAGIDEITTTLKLRNVNNFELTPEGKMYFGTKNSTETKAAIVSMSQLWISKNYNTEGALIETGRKSYVSTNYSNDVKIMMWLHFD